MRRCQPLVGCCGQIRRAEADGSAMPKLSRLTAEQYSWQLALGPAAGCDLPFPGGTCRSTARAKNEMLRRDGLHAEMLHDANGVIWRSLSRYHDRKSIYTHIRTQNRMLAAGRDLWLSVALHREREREADSNLARCCRRRPGRLDLSAEVRARHVAISVSVIYRDVLRAAIIANWAAVK